MRRTIGLLSVLSLIGSTCVDPCGNDILTEMRSPDGRLRFVVFQRDCGPTTGFSTQVSILTSDAGFLTTPTWLRSTRSGNAFVADTNHGEAPSGPGGGPVVQVEWLGPNRLKIIHDKRARVFKSAQSVNGVSVEYVSQ